MYKLLTFETTYTLTISSNNIKSKSSNNYFDFCPMYIALYDVAIKYVKYIGHKEVIVAEAPLMVHICIENKER